MRKRLPIWADATTQITLRQRFGYTFEQVPGTLYKPILEMNDMTGQVSITGDGGTVTLTPFLVDHGPIQANGFRIGNLAYLPDVSAMNDIAWEQVENLDMWIVDALRREPHPTHSHLDQTLDWIKRAAPRNAILTNMHNDLDYQTVCDETPDHITAAFDGMQIGMPA